MNQKNELLGIITTVGAEYKRRRAKVFVIRPSLALPDYFPALYGASGWAVADGAL